MLSDRGGRGRPAAHRRETAPPGDTGAAGATGVTKGHWVTEDRRALTVRAVFVCVCRYTCFMCARAHISYMQLR